MNEAFGSRPALGSWGLHKILLYPIMDISYNGQEHEMRALSKVVTFQK